jgi:uncharacterized protein (TIGR01370 family)
VSHLPTIPNYACYYGTDRLDQLQRFSLVILQPEGYTSNEIQCLRTHGTLTLSYLSLGENAAWVEGATWYLHSDAGGLRRNPDWNTWYVDTRDPAWSEYLLTTRIPAILTCGGFDGLFLDTLDSQDLFPEIRDGSIALVHAIRAAYPEVILVANRGFTILDCIAHDLDGLVFESFSTYHRAGRYSTWKTPQREYHNRLADWLNHVRHTHSLVILTLDYALASDVARIEYATRRARAYGFVPYMSTAHLEQIYYLPDAARTG